MCTEGMSGSSGLALQRRTREGKTPKSVKKRGFKRGLGVLEGIHTEGVKRCQLKPIKSDFQR